MTSTRMQTINQMLEFHLRLLGTHTKPSKYIPYRSVYAESQRQHKSAIYRLNKLRRIVQEEEDAIESRK